MLNCADFYNLLKDNGINFFAGVPDSLLKDFCAYITDHAPSHKNILAANEGNALALAAGHYLATGEPGMVYLQNSGLGNLVNPLTSLTDPLVYGIPVLLLIGWRGEPGVRDEPQHAKQGMITLELLDTLGVPHSILPGIMADAGKVIKDAARHMRELNEPYGLVVPGGTFAPYSLRESAVIPCELHREDAIKLILSRLDPEDVVISTTGKASREVFEYRELTGEGHRRDFLTVGSMGHASQIALGIALSRPERNVYCLDGDGSLIMHMGSLAIVGEKSPANFKHVILNNGAHDSVGGQPTAAPGMDIPAIASACGYKTVLRAETKGDAAAKTVLLKSCPGPALLEIRVNRGARKDLGRPSTTPAQNKEDFMNFLK